MIRVGGLLQPGHVWRKQRNILQVDLHTRHVCLNAVATLWIILQDCTHDRINTHTHTDGCYVKIQEASQHSLSKSWSTGPLSWSDWPNKSAHPALSPANKQEESAERPSKNQRPGLSLECEQVKGKSGSWVWKVKETLLFLPWESIIRKKRHLLTESSLHSLAFPASSRSSMTDVRRHLSLLKLITHQRQMSVKHTLGWCLCTLATHQLSWPEPRWNTQRCEVPKGFSFLFPFEASDVYFASLLNCRNLITGSKQMFKKISANKMEAVESSPYLLH